MQKIPFNGGVAPDRQRLLYGEFNLAGNPGLGSGFGVFEPYSRVEGLVDVITSK